MKGDCDKFWAECVRRVGFLRRVGRLSTEEAQAEFDAAPRASLSADEIDRILSWVSAAELRARQEPEELNVLLRWTSSMPRPRLRQLVMAASIARRCDLADAVERNPRALAQWLRKGDTMTCQDFERVARKGIAGSAETTAAAASAAAAMMAACAT